MLQDLEPEVVEAAKGVGVERLTEVQLKAIPKVMSGRHTLIIAPTGSGKTEAALLPIMSKIIALKRHGAEGSVSAIYITPLRSLNRDMLERFRRLGRRTGIKVAIRHGDTPASLRRAIASNPPDLLITTPETLSYLLVSDKFRRSLRSVKWVVVDEFHEILNSKRGTHLLADLERLKNIVGSFQRVALSASIGNVGLATEALAPGKLVEVVHIPGVREAELKVLTPADGFTDKVEAIAALIKDYSPAIVFTNTRDEAEWLGVKLSNLGLKVRVHHGSLSKSEREEVEAGLKTGSLNAVVATSSLELGIDVGSINAVIQSSSPRQAMKLLQRVGRSLHRVGSRARGFIASDLFFDDIIESLVLARRAEAGDLEELRPYLNSIDVLAHVITGMGMEGEGFTLEEALSTLRRSFPYRELEDQDLALVLELLQELRYLRKVGELYRATTRGKIYYYRNTMIVDTEQYRVIDALRERTVGKLDSDFITINVTEGSTVVLGGRIWRVIGIDDDDRKVFVDESAGEAVIPSWSGESIPVDYKVAREVCGLRKLMLSGKIPHPYEHLITKASAEVLRRTVQEHVAKGYPLPSESLILVEVIKGATTLVVVHACLGSRGNRALSYLVAAPFSRLLGLNPRNKVDPYRVFIELPYQISFEKVRNLIEGALRSANVIESVEYGIKNSGMGLMVARKVLSRLGIIPKEAPARVAKVIVKRYLDDELIWREVLNETLTHYIDVQPLKKVVDGIRKGKIKLKFVYISEPSPLALEGMKAFSWFDKVRANRLPKELVAELVKRRLLNKEVKLYCMVCGYSWSAKISELPERISCPKCGYSLVAPYFGRDDVSGIVRKGLKAGRRYKYVMTGEERKVFEEMLDSADLVLTYGKRAVIALASRGIGPKTARRILGAGSDVEFFNSIYDAERNFLRTKRYWSS